MTSKLIKTLISASAVIALANACSNAGSSASETGQAVSAKDIAAVSITKFPAKIDKSCRNGKAKLYDECTSQFKHIAAALPEAEATGKTILVSYGAEWCIWCHVFDAYINGYVEDFTYTYGEPGKDARYTHTMHERAETDVSQAAYDLKKYVSDNFIIVHIEGEHAPGGDTAMQLVKAWNEYNGGMPFIFSLDKVGYFATAFNSKYTETRRDTDDWYRGYDRARLLEELQRMRAAAVGE